MKILKDVLTDDKIKQYEGGWANFKGKYRVNSPRNVHSGMPVISEVYRFESSPVFRAHVFGRKLRTFDPYHQADKCIQPFWHAQHYIMVAEQMYTASSRLVVGDKYDKQIAKDIPVEFNWKKPTFFEDNIAVELIIEELGTIGAYKKQAGYFTFYSEKSGRALSRMSAFSFWRPRAYIRDIEKIKQGDTSVIDDLIRKIEAQAINHKRLRKPRITLKTTQDYLVKALKEGNISEEELHDFFSLWEKEI